MQQREQTQLESSLYKGIVHHQRFVPKVHRFSYSIYLYWLKLSELPILHEEVKGFSTEKKGFNFVKFIQDDYLAIDDSSKPNDTVDFEQQVINRMSELNGSALHGEVFFFGQVRTFGWYFSPVNFYYLRNDQGLYTHMLAEVSNTPWNKRHHYLVDLSKQENSDKMFHVSPFNPMDMSYQWRIQQPDENLKLYLACIKDTKHFEAAIDMHREPLNTKTLRRALLSIPSMTLKTVAGIYWQATKLFFKRVPIYMHP
ncbi:DUF1365 domain-containing protein [Glaciecola sp. MH2013]|uniref:DUF1365 domain-containing protein n=1 Tax=Glaciecola sp. MH2013 TaxID=2785524 RepID=UPI00189DF52E|nr:DUF1365 domain-containing protein [Glaciecola sp. MH2013]MBF7074699.1 DUF1365 domain-containing protein [Glaciecola sp. MH2013]